MNITFVIASTAEHFADGRKLFEEYAASLNFDLCFQGFSEELDNLNKQYQFPTGALIIAYNNTNPIAVVGIREFEIEKAELKRMYTIPEYRGQNLGNKLLDQAISIATELGYKQLLLDTLPEMKAAIKIYTHFGFITTTAYRYNPFDTAIYMLKELLPANKI